MGPGHSSFLSSGLSPVSTSSTSSSLPNGTYYYPATDMWVGSTNATVGCVPPCTVVIPPYRLSTPTTITWKPYTTRVCATASGNQYYHSEVTVTVPPITTNAIEFWPGFVAANGSDAVFQPMPSVTPPPISVQVPGNLGQCPLLHHSGFGVSPDGSCGVAPGFWYCPGSKFGRCCGKSNQCGSDDGSCGNGCNNAYGNCSSTVGFATLSTDATSRVIIVQPHPTQSIQPPGPPPDYISNIHYSTGVLPPSATCRVGCPNPPSCPLRCLPPPDIGPPPGFDFPKCGPFGCDGGCALFSAVTGCGHCGCSLIASMFGCSCPKPPGNDNIKDNNDNEQSYGIISFTPHSTPTSSQSGASTKASSSSQASSSSSCETTHTVTDAYVSCTVTASSGSSLSCRITSTRIVSGCTVSATTSTTTVGGSCPFATGITVSPDDDQGENGCAKRTTVTNNYVSCAVTAASGVSATPSCTTTSSQVIIGCYVTANSTTTTAEANVCPYVPGVTISPNDDQGECGYANATTVTNKYVSCTVTAVSGSSASCKTTSSRLVTGCRIKGNSSTTTVGDSCVADAPNPDDDQGENGSSLPASVLASLTSAKPTSTALSSTGPPSSTCRDALCVLSSALRTVPSSLLPTSSTAQTTTRGLSSSAPNLGPLMSIITHLTLSSSKSSESAKTTWVPPPRTSLRFTDFSQQPESASSALPLIPTPTAAFMLMYNWLGADFPTDNQWFAYANNPMELAKSGKELDVCAASFQNFPADPVVDPAKGIPYPGGVFVMKSLVDGHAACVYDGSADAAGRFSCPGLDGGRPVNCFQDPLDALGTNYTCAPIGILGDVRPVIFPKIFCQWGAARASSVVVTAEIPLPPTDGVELPSVTPPPASSSNSCELPWDSRLGSCTR
ncbi:hypothetical protein LTR66_011718 [Elasticomyces elasticus]|nr:hypothetical protein LTR66_011718 [Elasticomyces elasticus]